MSYNIAFRVVRQLAKLAGADGARAVEVALLQA
jgi:hypothetical protein